MTPAEIPRPQAQRVALYEQRFGKFDSGKNAYWSLRKERPVSLAEGARFDVAMRAGQLAPTGYIKATRLPVKQFVSPVPAGAPPMWRGLGYPGKGQISDQVAFRGGRMGWWRYPSGRVVQGRQLAPPSRTTGLKWSLDRPGKRPPIAPQEVLTTMPTEAKLIDKLPATPPPGPARPPAEPMFDAVMKMLQEKKAGPATQVTVTQPAWAAPGRPLTTAAPPAPMAIAGFDMKKLALPLALVAGAYVVSKLV